MKEHGESKLFASVAFPEKMKSQKQKEKEKLISYLHYVLPTWQTEKKATPSSRLPWEPITSQSAATFLCNVWKLSKSGLGFRI